MSRTSRHTPQSYFIHGGVKIYSSEVDWKAGTIKGSSELFNEIFGYGKYIGHKYLEDYSRASPDGKPWDKPNKQFKKMYRQMERAKAKQAVSQDKEPEIVKKSDRWNWT